MKRPWWFHPTVGWFWLLVHATCWVSVLGFGVVSKKWFHDELTLPVPCCLVFPLGLVSAVGIVCGDYPKRPEGGRGEDVE